jgi:hypothetical protein
MFASWFVPETRCIYHLTKQLVNTKKQFIVYVIVQTESIQQSRRFKQASVSALFRTKYTSRLWFDLAMILKFSESNLKLTRVDPDVPQYLATC